VRDPDWWRIGLCAPEPDEEALTEALAEAGLEVQEVITAPSDVDVTGDALPAAGEVWLRSYVATEAREDALATLRAVVDAWGASVRLLEPAALERAAWSSWFEPVVVGAVRLAQPPDSSATDTSGEPSDARGEPGGEHVVWLRPGMGFGAGEHPTTRCTLAVLQRLALTGARVLDVGCGTGVLGLATLRLGAAGAVALDVEPDARRAAREHATLNELPLDVRDEPLETHDATYTVVVANILLPVLTALAPALMSRVAPGGHLVLSGVRTADLARLFVEYPGWGERERAEEDGWCAVVLARLG
jgi:ribosomal protein L11 methyltransferase